MTRILAALILAITLAGIIYAAAWTPPVPQHPRTTEGTR